MRINTINSGDVFGHLKVIQQEGWHIYPNGNRTRKYLCKCECGNTKNIIGKLLKSGNSKSCGCNNFTKKRKRYRLYHCNDCEKEVTKGVMRCNRCNGIFQQGENNPNWKGGMTYEKDRIRNSKEYKKWRTDCFIRDNYTCQISGVKGGELVVHHLNSFMKLIKEGKELFDLDNGITIHKTIHQWFHRIYGIRNFNGKQFQFFKNNINGIEIKFDEYAKYSGNFYIEFECNGKPSGIFKKEKLSLKYWGHSDGEELFLLKGDSFRKWVKEKIDEARNNKNVSLSSKGFMVVEKGGNGGRTKGLVLKVDLLKDQAYKTYII